MLRRLYVVGAMVDLELSLRNLANGQQTGGDFHTAMTERVKKAKAKVDAILKAVDIPELSNALAMPPDDLQTASRTFVNTYDGTTLAGLDGLIPKKTKGKAFTR